MNDGMSIEQLLKQQGYHISTTSGSSMYPMLRDRRDTIIVYAVEGRLKKYDVPLYKAGGNYILHRIIEVKPDYYVVRGDNCFQKEIVRDEQIIGVLTEVYRGEKKVHLQGLGYKLYARLWNMLYPIRCIVKRLKGKLCYSKK